MTTLSCLFAALFGFSQGAFALSLGGVANGSIDTDKISAGAIDTGKILTDAVTPVKLLSDSGGLAKVTGQVAHISGSNLGIGTASPDTILDIDGGNAVSTITVGNASNGSGALFLYSNNAASGGLYLGAADGIMSHMYMDGSGYALFSPRPSYGFAFTSGNVGIGTASPATKLHVSTGGVTVDGTNAHLRLNGGSGEVGTGSTLYIGDPGIEGTIHTAGTARLTLTPRGGYGVGMVVGSGATGDVRVSTSATSAYSTCLKGAVDTLPTSNTVEGCIVYQVSDHGLYVSTESVTSADSWKKLW